MAHSSALRAQRLVIRQRLLSAVVGLPILLGLVWVGGWVYVVGVLIAALWSAFELFDMARRAGYQPSWPVGLAGTAVLALAPIVFAGASDLPIMPTVVLLASLVFLIHHLGRSRTALTDALITLGGAYYLGFLFGYLILLRGLPDGQGLLVLLLLGTFAADTGGFVVGRRWGRHRLAPNVSPNKTREGAVGGLIAGTLASVALIWLLSLPFTWWQALLVGFLLTLGGQLGDLAESALKRGLEAKDAGVLIPGHGGILDRADSLLFAGVVLYFSVRILEIFR